MKCGCGLNLFKYDVTPDGDCDWKGEYQDRWEKEGWTPEVYFVKVIVREFRVKSV